MLKVSDGTYDVEPPNNDDDCVLIDFDYCDPTVLCLSKQDLIAMLKLFEENDA